MSNQNNSNSTRVNKSDLLVEKEQTFSKSMKDVIDILSKHQQKNADNRSLQTISGFIETSVDLIKHYETLLETPTHVHGPTYNTDVSNRSLNPTYNNYEHNCLDVQPNIEVTVITERFYRLGTNFIVSTSGNFVYRPKTRQLFTTVGEFELSEIEAQALYDRMKFDYGL